MKLFIINIIDIVRKKGHLQSTSKTIKYFRARGSTIYNTIDEWRARNFFLLKIIQMTNIIIKNVKFIDVTPSMNQ